MRKLINLKLLESETRQVSEVTCTRSQVKRWKKGVSLADHDFAAYRSIQGVRPSVNFVGYTYESTIPIQSVFKKYSNLKEKLRNKSVLFKKL